ncbi:MAG TPA: sigma-70 family RNA polymerase sigma factor [Candidatus Baltobacteraceae bacterium]|nr:sigma-70 family RNA polymerase sigma factor [Candidatus Baltobacteraceae bacterium]
MEFSVDPGLVRRARHDRPAMDALITQVWPEVFRVALGIVRERASAEDAAQEACAAIVRSLPALRDDRAFYGWMYRIAGRCAVDAAKRAARETSSPQESAAQPDLDGTIDLRGAIARLPVSQRTAVVLHYFAGLSSGEIAGVLGVPSPTVRFHLMLARKALRQFLRARDAREETVQHV